MHGVSIFCRDGRVSRKDGVNLSEAPCVLTDPYLPTGGFLRKYYKIPMTCLACKLHRLVLTTNPDCNGRVRDAATDAQNGLKLSCKG
jgi:hypothetical protein